MSFILIFSSNEYNFEKYINKLYSVFEFKNFCISIIISSLVTLLKSNGL